MGVTLDLSRAPTKRRAPPNLTGLSRNELAAALVEAGVVAPEKAKMRASQLWRWIHHYGVTDFAAMTDVAKETRAAIAEVFSLARPEIVERQVSKDGTRKWLIRTAPGIEVETVYIPDVGRAGALCVSSQVGCTLNCTFCHTGTQALVRNLTAAEIVAQVQVARDDLGEWPSPKADRRLTNIVFMGMGEPLYNLDHVAQAIDIIADNEGIAISRRRITVSTSGVVPELQALGEKTQAMLAISLHATTDTLRDQLVPVNKRWPIRTLLDAAAAYGHKVGRRVTLEYTLLGGVNDSLADADRLSAYARELPSKINIIPYNPVPGLDWKRPTPESIRQFAEWLYPKAPAVTVRNTLGGEIWAACGQLGGLSPAA